MLSNAYFLAKFRFDTAENEPAKNLRILQNFAKAMARSGWRAAGWPGPPLRGPGERRGHPRGLRAGHRLLRRGAASAGPVG